MTVLLEYLLIAAAIGLVVFFVAVFVFGRGEQMAPLSPRMSPVELPESGITPKDVRSLRFALALRGYRMSDVDWALEQMAAEISRLRDRIGDLTGETTDELAGETTGDLTGETTGELAVDATGDLAGEASVDAGAADGTPEAVAGVRPGAPGR